LKLIVVQEIIKTVFFHCAICNAIFVTRIDTFIPPFLQTGSPRQFGGEGCDQIIKCQCHQRAIVGRQCDGRAELRPSDSCQCKKRLQTKMCVRIRRSWRTRHDGHRKLLEKNRLKISIFIIYYQYLQEYIKMYVFII